MNKALSIVLCYVIGMAACSVRAASPVMSMDFSESALWGKTPQWGLSDFGLDGQVNTRWWTPTSNGNYSVIRDYTNKEALKKYVRFDDARNPQPDYMQAGEANLGFLPFSTAVTLYRTIKTVENDGTSEQQRYNSGSDIFFDQLVQFERRDERARESIAPFLPESAKFACWLPSDTNVLVVTAGRLAHATNSVPYVTNYVTTANVETGRWYRLTVRVLDNAATDGGTDKVQAMALYLDGARITCGADYAIGDDDAAMEDRFRGNPHYDARALFPSMLVAAAGKMSSSGVYGQALLGQGAIDEIGVMTSGNPLSPVSEAGAEEIDLCVSVEPEKVTNVCVTVTPADGSETFVTNTTGEATTVVAVKPQETASIAVKTIADATPADKVTYFGNTAALSTIDRNKRAYSFKLAGKFQNPDPLVVRVDVNVANFVVDGETCETAKEAMSRAWGKDGAGSRKFSLRRDLTLDRSAVKDNGQLFVLPEYTNLVFDLCGHWIRGEHFREEAAVYNQGGLTIVDSVGGGGIAAAGKAIEVAKTNVAIKVNYANAALTLGDREISGDFTVTGRVVCANGELVLKGGSYVTPTDLMPTTEFYLSQYVAPERFYASNDLERCSTPGELWTVRYDGRFRVGFEVAHGEVVPAYTNVDVSAGAHLSAPAILNAAGYTVTNWYVKGTAPRLDWNLAADAVTNDMVLVGQQRLDGYTISYSKATMQATWPTEYTVESAYQELPVPEKLANYSFARWRDRTTGHAVAAIGAGAKWADADEPVAGDLDLVAEWQADVLKWTNIGTYSSESNGYYSGTWRFTVPASGTISVGREVVVDEIAFCVVNPLTLPKSAPYLAVTPESGPTVFSATRPMGYDPASGEYAAATNTLSNGRVRLSYRFSDLTVRADADNVVQFSETSGSVTPFSGFLRLAVRPTADDLVFGNCLAPEDYQVYCPVYEVYGHVKGDVE